MLDQQDLKAISDLLSAQKTELEATIDTKIRESEQRMEAIMDSKLQASEQRMEATMDSKIRDSEVRLFTYLENTLEPQIRLLAEGQQTILETLTPKSKTQELEDEIGFLKSILKSYAERIAALEAKVS